MQIGKWDSFGKDRQFLDPGMRPNIINPRKAGFCLRFAQNAWNLSFSALGGTISGKKKILSFHLNITLPPRKNHRGTSRFKLGCLFVRFGRVL